MRRAYIHIGVEKTGTSYLQKYLAQNRAKLREWNYIYPKKPGHENHLRLAIYAAPKFTERLMIKLKSESVDVEAFQRNFRKKFVRELKGIATNDSNIIISSEHLSSRLHTKAQLLRIKDLFRDWDTKIILYLREQDSMLVSLYSTSLKSGNPHKFGNFIKRNSKWFDYNALYDLWEGVFGAENIDVRLYGKAYFENGNLLDDFLSAVNLKNFEGINIDARNESLDIYQLKFLEIFNEYCPDIIDGSLNRSRNDIVKALEITSGDDRIKLSKSTRKVILDRYSKSNSALAKKVFNRDKLFHLSENESYDGVDVIPKLTYQKCVEIMANLWIYKKDNENGKKG